MLSYCAFLGLICLQSPGQAVPGKVPAAPPAKAAATVLPPKGLPPKIDEPTRESIRKALDWLVTKQNPDGSWSETGFPHNTAITSFVVLALLSDGQLPGRGRHGESVAMAARFLVASARDQDGLLVGARGAGGREMYCHGMATLALGQLWGVGGPELDDAIRPVLKRAVDLIVRVQNPQGGWRYAPAPNDADISVTVMQVMALRAARNSGLHVPDVTLDKAFAYINSCRDPKSGGYSYQAGQNAPEFARTAAGVCVLHLCGRHSAQEIPQAVEYLEKMFSSKHHFWYGHYYASHAMHQVGGTAWNEWYAKLQKTILPKQGADGAWAGRDLDSASPGPVYNTAIAVIALSVPGQFVPIFQR